MILITSVCVCVCVLLVINEKLLPSSRLPTVLVTTSCDRHCVLHRGFRLQDGTGRFNFSVPAPRLFVVGCKNEALKNATGTVHLEVLDVLQRGGLRG